MNKYVHLVEKTLNEGTQYVVFYPDGTQQNYEDFETGFKSEKEAKAWIKKYVGREDQSDAYVEKMSDKEVKKLEKEGYEKWAKGQDHLPSSRQGEGDFD